MTDVPSRDDNGAKVDPVKLLRSLVGLVLAPVVGGAVVMAAMTLPDMLQGDRPEIFGGAMLGATIGGTYGVVPALVIGWPVHLFLLSRRWTHPLVYIGFGVALAIIAFFAGGMGLMLSLPEGLD